MARLQALLTAGFQFVTFEQFARHPAVQKEGFVALLDLSGEKVRMLGSVGYDFGKGIGVLIERGGERLFVCKDLATAATPELLATYQRVKAELAVLLREEQS